MDRIRHLVAGLLCVHTDVLSRSRSLTAFVAGSLFDIQVATVAGRSPMIPLNE